MKERIGIVGAGLMGSEIAWVFALAGHHVRLADQTAEQIQVALSRLRSVAEKGIARGFHDSAAADAALGRISASGMEAFSDCDFVTEAVFEDLEVKSAVLATLSRVCAPRCLVATNTSTIPISTLASRLPPERRSRFVGTHYFSPVSRMKLVEIIPGLDSDEAAVAEATRLCSGAGKTAVRVKDVAGFAVNRVLHAFLIEAVRLVEEGIATPEDLDRLGPVLLVEIELQGVIVGEAQLLRRLIQSLVEAGEPRVADPCPTDNLSE